MDQPPEPTLFSAWSPSALLPAIKQTEPSHCLSVFSVKIFFYLSYSPYIFDYLIIMCPQDFVSDVEQEVRVEEEKGIKMQLAFALGFKHFMHFINL